MARRPTARSRITGDKGQQRLPLESRGIGVLDRRRNGLEERHLQPYLTIRKTAELSCLSVLFGVGRGCGGRGRRSRSRRGR